MEVTFEIKLPSTTKTPMQKMVKGLLHAAVQDKVRRVAVMNKGRTLKLHMVGIPEAEVKEFVQPVLETI